MNRDKEMSLNHPAIPKTPKHNTKFHDPERFLMYTDYQSFTNHLQYILHMGQQFF